MADKYYLDAEGVARLKQYIDDQFEQLRQAIDLLKDTNGTPGSIQSMIDDAINKVDVISGGSAPSEEEVAP